MCVHVRVCDEEFAENFKWFQINKCANGIHILQIYPLWLCPFHLPANPGMVHSPSDKSEMYVDIGVYGVPKAVDFKPQECTRSIEKFVTKVKG